MPRRLFGVAAAPALAILLAACPAAGPNGGTPTPSVGTLEAAAAAYERLADDFNARNAELGELFEGDQTLPELQAAFRQVAELDEAFLEGLDEITFPEEVEDEATALRAAVEAQLEVNRQLVDAEDFGEYFGIMGQAQPIFFAVTDAANELRRALGLDPAPTIAPLSPLPGASPTD